MPARLALGCPSLERKALLRALPATVPGSGLSRFALVLGLSASAVLLACRLAARGCRRSAVLARLRRFNNPAGGEVYGATGCTAFLSGRL